MSTAEKIKTPEEMYEECRQISLNANLTLIEETKIIMSRFYNKKLHSKEIEEAEKNSKDALCFAYRSFPYLKILFKWEYENFPREDLQLFSNYFQYLYNYEEDTVKIYLRTINAYTNIITEFCESPEQAERPLTAKERKLFDFFLKEILKPATENLINNIKNGDYRTLKEISKDRDSMLLESIDIQKQAKINSEIDRPSRDLFVYINAYSIDSNFDKAITEAFENNIKISEVFEVKKLEMPLDKVNLRIWNFPISPREPLTFAMESEADKRKGRELDAAYSIDFSALEENGNVKITKKLTPYDKRVYTAIGAIYNAGNTVTSLTQIYYAMGNTSRPSKALLENIYNSIVKMLKAYITLDNEDEAKVYNYPHFTYEGSLLPIEMLSNVDIKGKITESAINIFREPPVLSYAKGRNQVTTVPVKLLQSPINKTEASLMLEDYLIYRIAKAKPGKDKKPKLSNIIKLETLYEEMEITDRRAKPRLLEKVDRYLDYYKKVEYIVDYKITKEEIILKFKESENDKEDKKEDEETATA